MVVVVVEVEAGGERALDERPVAASTAAADSKGWAGCTADNCCGLLLAY
jgi:hypothetical protein